MVHGRNGAARGGSIGFVRKVSYVGDAGALGFGVNVRVEVPGGMVTWDVDSPR